MKLITDLAEISTSRVFSFININYGRNIVDCFSNELEIAKSRDV